MSYPVRIERYELVEDSEGPGRHRGGLGIRRDYFFPDAEVTFTILADRDREGPAGALGGQPGRRARYILNPGPSEIELSSKTTVQLSRGDLVRYETCGGGGYGPVEERSRDAIVRDVVDERISAERAVAVYGLSLDDVPAVPVV